ncbi:MAG: hypothetical protein ABUT20_09065 [Bacteroidota bacterium]
MKILNLTKILILIFSSLLIAFISWSQKYPDNSKSRSFPESYSLDQLPDQWKKKPKILQAVDDILPAAIKQLKGRRSCTNCKAGFYVSVKLDTLYVDSQTAEDHGNDETLFENTFYTTLFRFRSHFSITDSAGQEIAKMIIVSPDEDSYVLHKALDYRIQKGVKIPVIDKGIVLIPSIDYYYLQMPSNNSGVLLNENLLVDYSADKIKTMRSRIRKLETADSK